MSEVYVFEIEDGDALAWRSEVALLARDRRDAFRRLKVTGLHKKQIDRGGLVRVEPVAAWPALADRPDAMFRRQDNDGWADWTEVPPGASLNWRKRDLPSQ